MIISHDHQDHFSNNLVLSCLNRNKDIKLFVSNTVKDQLLKSNNSLTSIQTPTNYNSILNKEQNNFLEIVMHKIPHADDPQNEIDNIGFLIKLNKYAIFFPGDGLSNNIEAYKNKELSKYKIDIFFAPKWFFTSEYGNGGIEIIKYLNPKHIIGMHIESNKSEEYKNISKNLLTDYSVLFFENELSGAAFENKNGKIIYKIF